MATVLCTGVQPALMQTRKLILESAGHKVVTAQSDSEIIAACQEFRFDVAIIGQSAQPKLKRDWCSLVREHCPLVKVLEVYMTSAGIALRDADYWIESPAVPVELAETVSALAATSKANLMMAKERIRQACARVTTAQGDDFAAALEELADALKLFETREN